MRLTFARRTAAITSPIVVATALLVAGCAGTEETTTVTSTITAPSGGSDARAYRGTTDQGLPVSFVVRGNAVLGFTFGWRAPCEDGSTRSNSIRLGGTSIHKGVFSFGGVLETGGVAQVEGRVSGDRASGSFSRSRGTAFGVDCKVADVAWQARSGPGTGQSS